MPENKRQITILEMCDRVLNLSLSDAQAALLAAIYQLPMTEAQREMFKIATGREYAPRFHKDILALAGRRSGKTSRIIAPLAVYETCVVKHKIPFFERGVFLIVAPSEKQAAQTAETIVSTIEGSIFRKMIVSAKQARNDFRIKLSNRIDIITGASDRMHLRGPLYVSVALEESSFFRDSNSGRFNLDEVMAAIRPGLITDPLARMLRASSVWTMAGPNFDDWQRREEKPDLLAWKLESALMNPTTLPAEELQREKERDESYYNREYLCIFASAANALIDPEDIDAAVERGKKEFPPGDFRAVCALDPSSKGDDFAIAIAHAEEKKIRLDYVKRWRPEGGKLKKYLNYAEILPEIVATMKRYACSTAFSDQVSAAAISSALAAENLGFEHVTTYGTKAAELYQTVRQKFVAREVILPDHPELIAQLKRLEEIRGEGGKSSVGAATGRDDLAVAACAAIYQAALGAVACDPGPALLVFSPPTPAGSSFSRPASGSLGGGSRGGVEIEWDEQGRRSTWISQ